MMACRVDPDGRCRTHGAPHYLYRLYGPDGRLWYVGVTFDLGNRLANHRSGRCAGYAWHKAEIYPGDDEVLAAERLAIHDENPLLNRQRPRVRPGDRERLSLLLAPGGER